MPVSVSATDVSRLLPQRAGGAFTATTVPSLAQVQAIAHGFADTVLWEAGFSSDGCQDVPEVLEDLACRTAAYGAAQQVELSFFPEQQEEQSRSSALLFAMYQRHLDLLRRMVVSERRTRVPAEWLEDERGDWLT